MKAYEGRVEPDEFEVDFAKIDTVGRCCILFLVLCCHLCLLVAPFDFLLGRKVHLLLQLTWICHMKKRKRSLRGQSKKRLWSWRDLFLNLIHYQHQPPSPVHPTPLNPHSYHPPQHPHQHYQTCTRSPVVCLINISCNQLVYTSTCWQSKLTFKLCSLSNQIGMVTVLETKIIPAHLIHLCWIIVQSLDEHAFHQVNNHDSKQQQNKLTLFLNIAESPVEISCRWDIFLTFISTHTIF
jgi:hypothetical protein